MNIKIINLCFNNVKSYNYFVSIFKKSLKPNKATVLKFKVISQSRMSIKVSK